MKRVGVIGLGALGTSVAYFVASKGYKVIGYDIDKDRVLLLNNKQEAILEVDEPGLIDLIDQYHIKTSTNPSVLHNCDIILICVNTPIKEDSSTIDIDPLNSAIEAIATFGKEKVLVIVNSTLIPGTTNKIIKPLLAEKFGPCGEGFYLAVVPERAMSGKMLSKLEYTDHIIGADELSSKIHASSFYRTLLAPKADIYETNSTTAEMVKVVENAYRYLNIAFANHIGKLCESLGLDFGRVRHLVNTSPGRDMLAAGPGVGGHCLEKDTVILNNLSPNTMLQMAQTENKNMPYFITNIVAHEIPIGVRLLIAGQSYLEDTGFLINSPSQEITAMLNMFGYNLVVHDPFVYGHPFLEKFIEGLGIGAIIFLVGHTGYKLLDWEQIKMEMEPPYIIIDTRQILTDTERLKLKKLGFNVKGF